MNFKRIGAGVYEAGNYYVIGSSRNGWTLTYSPGGGGKSIGYYPTLRHAKEAAAEHESKTRKVNQL